jgi:hypothetical protein
MQRDKLIQVLAWRLGNRKDMAERIANEMDFVQETVLEQNPWLPWFLEKDAEGLILPAGASAVALPVDFLGEIEGEIPLAVVEEGELRYSKESPVDMAVGGKRGIKFAYTVTTTQLRVFPSFEEELPLSWRYFAKAPTMSIQNEETLWLKYAADLTMAAIGVEIAGKHLQNQVLLSQFQTDTGIAWKRLLDKDTSIREINQNRSLGRAL